MPSVSAACNAYFCICGIHFSPVPSLSPLSVSVKPDLVSLPLPLLHPSQPGSHTVRSDTVPSGNSSVCLSGRHLTPGFSSSLRFQMPPAPEHICPTPVPLSGCSPADCGCHNSPPSALRPAAASCRTPEMHSETASFPVQSQEPISVPLSASLPHWHAAFFQLPFHSTYHPAAAPSLLFRSASGSS